MILKTNIFSETDTYSRHAVLYYHTSRSFGEAMAFVRVLLIIEIKLPFL